MGPTRGGVFHWDFNITHARFNIQWPCNRSRLIGGTDSIYKAYVLGLNFREYPNIPAKYGQQYGTFTYLHLLDPFLFPLKYGSTILKWTAGDGSRTKTGVRGALRG